MGNKKLMNYTDTISIAKPPRLTVRIPLAANVHPSAHHPATVMTSASFLSSADAAASRSSSLGGDTERDARGRRRYARDTPVPRASPGGGILCSRAMSWAVAAGTLSRAHDENDEIDENDGNDEGHTSRREDKLLLDDLLE